MTRYAVPAPPVQLPHGHLSAAGAPPTASASADRPSTHRTTLLVGTAAQVTDSLKRLKEGLTPVLIWPPFRDVPVSKTLDDLKRPKHEIMPKVEAI